MEQKKIFVSGMDSDTTFELLPEGRDPFRLNVRVLSSNNSTIGAIETMNGNTLVSFVLPTGTNTVIGSKEDLKRQKVYYFVHNSVDSHLILEYDSVANSIAKVFQDSLNILDGQTNILRFKLTNLITSINIVELDSNNHLLYWTDNWVDPTDPFIYNEPKKINIEKGKYRMAGNYVLGYPQIFDPEILFRIKQPDLCQPICVYKSDPLVNINYLTQKLFQFKTQLVYDDNEVSSCSPISKTVYPECDCGSTESEKLNNYISVTFATGIEIVKRILVYAKEVNAIDYVLVADLDKAELDIPSNSEYTFDFYNNGNYLPLDTRESIKLYDRVPKRSQAEERIKGDLLTDGNITEEFDPVDVDMKLNLSIEPDIASPTYSIRGRILIPNLIQTRSDTCVGFGETYYNRYQPIWYGDNSGVGSGAVWGGIGPKLCEQYNKDIDNYNQHLPDGGFYVYLAGTTHKAISSQQDNGLPTESIFGATNVYLIDTDGKRDDVRDKMSDGLVYSTFEINDVPPGKYILRISPDSDQTHSTYTCGVGGDKVSECTIEVLKNGQIKSIIGVANQSDAFHIYDSFILDMTAARTNEIISFTPNFLPRACVVDGYVKDAEGFPIELSAIRLVRETENGQPDDSGVVASLMDDNLVDGYGLLNPFIAAKISGINYFGAGGAASLVTTDHNGFFFSLSFVGYFNPTAYAPSMEGLVRFRVDSLQIGTNMGISYTGGRSSDGFNCNGNSGGIPAPSLIRQSVIDNDLRTRLVGQIFYQGNPIRGVRAVTTQGSVAITDVDGFFEITIYPNSYADTRGGIVFYYLEGNCIAFFVEDQDSEVYFLTIGSGDYNYSNPYTLQDANIDQILGSSPVVSLKRGGNYLYGIIYLDHGNRSGLTNVNDWRFDEIDSDQNKYGTKLFVPFYTEQKLNDLAVVSFTMQVDTVDILSAGFGYDVPGVATITFSGGGAVTQATADLVIGDGLILQLGLTNGGYGYTIGTYAACALTGGSGTGATADVEIVDGAISSSTLTLAGSVYPADGSYLSVPLDGGTGTGATADITIAGGVVTVATIVNYGINYTVADVLTPNESVVGVPTTDAEITVNTIAPGIDTVVLVSGGSGYIVGDILAPDSGVVGVPTVAGTIDISSDYGTVIDINNITPGSGYTSMPTYVISDPNGVEATVQITMLVEDPLVIVTGGAGYSYVPLLSFVGGDPVVEATAEAEVVSGVVVSTELTNPGQGYKSFPTLNIQGNVWGGSFPKVDWEIYNQPPSWATHYQIARQKNSETDSYIDFVADAVLYVNDAGAASPPYTQIYIKVSNIYTQFKTMFRDSILAYDFTKGQRIRYVKTRQDEGAFYDRYWDFKIKAFDVATGVIAVEYDSLVDPPLSNFPPDPPEGGFSFEIYLPKLIIPDNEIITFEVGECYDVLLDSNNIPYHEGSDLDQLYWDFDASADNGGFLELSSSESNHGLVVGDKIRIQQNAPYVNAEYNTYAIVTDVPAADTIVVDVEFGSADPDVTGTVTRPATGKFFGGDTFYRFRRMPYNTGVVDVKVRLIQDSNFSDFYNSEGWDYGRPNKIDPQIKEVTRQSVIYFSQPLIPETEINGLSTVYDDDFEEYESSYGGIYKMRSKNQTVEVFQELKAGFVPVEQQQVSDTQGATFIGQSTTVLSPVMTYYDGEFGIGKNPESHSFYGHSDYFIDIRRGAFLRLSTDGLTPISKTVFFNNYISDKCKALLDSGVNPKIYTAYDSRFNEIIISFPSYTLNAVVYPAETVAFNEKENAWSTFYSFIPENMCSNGVDIVSFKNGGLYTHNTNALQANFYGTQYKPEVWVVLNDQPSIRKVLQAISEETNAAWEVYEILTPNGQKSSLLSTDFQDIEHNQFAEVLMDENTPNVVVSPAILPNAIIEGDVMRDRTFLCKFRYTGTDYRKLYSLNLRWIPSERTTS